MIVYSVVCVRMLVTVMAEPENEEVEFSWKRFVPSQSCCLMQVCLYSVLFEPVKMVCIHAMALLT